MSRAENIVSIYRELGFYLSKQPEAPLACSGPVYLQGADRLEKFIATPEFLKEQRAGVTSGFTQFATEFAQGTSVSGLSTARRKEVLQEFFNIVERYWPGFFEQHANKLQKILDRGHIESVREAELIRSYLDMVEQQPARKTQVQDLVRMLDAFGA